MIVVVGAGGHGREVADVVQAAGLVIAGFVDDGSPDLEPLRRRGISLLGTIDWLDGNAEVEVVVGVGDSRSRRSVAVELGQRVRFAHALVHPAATLGSDVQLGTGAVMCAGARITTHVAVGRHAYVGPNVTIGHDTVVGDFATVLPGATVSGNVHLGEACSIGTGANVRQGVTVGEGGVVGAGAVVVRDVAPGSTVVGVPAAPLRDGGAA